MKTMMPAFGLGKHGRPFVTGGLGYAPIGSTLPPVDAIISVEPVGGITGTVPSGATSWLPGDAVSEEPSSLESEEPVKLIMSAQKFGVTYYAEELAFLITDFSATPSVFGTLSVIQSLGQTGYAQGDIKLSSVGIELQNIGGAADDLTLDLRTFSHFGIPENPPFLPPDGDHLASSIPVNGADVSDTAMEEVIFRFEDPIDLPYDWVLVLRREEPSDTQYYRFWTNGFGNFPNGSLCYQLGSEFSDPDLQNTWACGGGSDIPMNVYGIVERTGLIVSGKPRDIVSEEPDDVESEEPI